MTKYLQILTQKNNVFLLDESNNEVLVEIKNYIKTYTPYFTLVRDGFSYITESEEDFLDVNFIPLTTEKIYKKSVMENSCGIYNTLFISDSSIVKKPTMETAFLNPVWYFFYDGTIDNRISLLNSIISSKMIEVEIMCDKYFDEVISDSIPKYKLYGLLLRTEVDFTYPSQEIEDEQIEESDSFRMYVGKLRRAPVEMQVKFNAIKNNSAISINEKIENILAMDIFQEIAEYVAIAD